MINNQYQKPLNDIDDYSYEKMKFLNTLFANWKQKMVDLQKTVEKGRAKLGWSPPKKRILRLMGQNDSLLILW